jgi:hypothetical protein
LSARRVDDGGVRSPRLATEKSQINIGAKHESNSEEVVEDLSCCDVDDGQLRIS